MKVFLRVVRYVKPYRWKLIAANFCMLVSRPLELLSYILLIPMLDVVFSPPNVGEVGATGTSVFNLGNYLKQFLAGLVAQYDRPTALLFLVIAVFASFLLKNLFSLVNQYLMADIEHGIMHRLRNDVYRHLQHLSLSYFTEERKGNLIATVVNDVRILNDSAMAVVNSFFRDPPTIVLSTLVLLLLDWQLTVIVALIIPIGGIIISRIADKLKKQSIFMQEKMADMMSVLDESLANVRIVKAFGMEEFETGRFSKESSRYADLMKTIQRRRNLASPISEMFGVIAIAVIVWFIGGRVISGTSSMTSSALIGYIVVLSQMLPPIKLFGQTFNSVQEGIGAAGRVFKILDTKPAILDKPSAAAVTGFKHQIRYENVSFKYETGDVVLKGVSLEIKQGERVAIVGPSGGGKSTLVDLLPRFYDPREGRITLDGMDLRDITVDSLRGLMGIVTQETILFNDTVRNNIAYGRSETSLDRIIEAATIANAHEFIARLPDGYDTKIGDRGTKLSGGQRQRISLARAILKNPPILIFDEATSALDTESEILVQEAVERTLAGRTSVVIAHRLSTIQHSDRIIVIEKGEIVEEGKHASLLANSNGVYKRLYELQFQV
ncbi:MAG: ABC transporter ATP-binding protein [Bacteroidetes bacterium]|nr:ABC transporter ATP-binding protein [Bacteroidota bacterium]MCW5897095.1 ABC transporter ATP-binding protein [Bacteroidota bacterium]